MKPVLKTAASWIVLAACAAMAAPAAAQPAPATAVREVETVIVTARKRDETDISTPVSITAMNAAQIERNAIFNVFDLAQRAPSLTINRNAAALGGSVYLRGVGTNVVSGNSLDQSVAFDFDGVPISRGNMLRIGSYDLEQIQMLKGPQALFFGKNSPAGVISFTSKDPTNEFETLVKLGYEPFAKTRSGEFAVSGPVSDTLKARLFGRYEKSAGTDKNLVAEALPANQIVPGAVFVPSSDRIYGYEEWFVRGTVLWEPTDRFTARFKASYDESDGAGPATLREKFYCPRGTAQNIVAASLPQPSGLGGGANAAALAAALSVDDCKLNGRIYKGAINPAQLIARPDADPDGESLNRVVLASAEFNYALTDNIDLTTVTGFARISEQDVENYGFAVHSAGALSIGTSLLHRQFTQEVRLQTSFDSPFNIMVGGFYQHAFLRTHTTNYAIPPHNFPDFHIPNDVWSGFAQATWDITDELELAAGARYTEEKKSLTFLRDFVPQPILNPAVTFTDTSPEATLTWRPTSDMTFYGAYKTGFKSGGYAALVVSNFPPFSPATARDFTYRPESVEGFEAGWKAQLFDRTLRVDATLYNYEFSDLQVTTVNSATGVPVSNVFNAATVRQKGVEVEASYYPPAVEGLRLHGMVNYNSAKYTEFLAPCYIGQSIAEGCNLNIFGGAFQNQELAGRRVTNAPLWVGSLGFNYTVPVDDMRVEFGGDAVYKSSYNPTRELLPAAVQDESTVLNLQFRVMNEEKGWEFGIYAKNLTDVRRAIEASNLGFTGNAANTGTANGGILSHADWGAAASPGRTVLFQVVLRPSEWAN